MRLRGTRTRGAAVLLAGVLAATAGCASWICPVAPPPRDLTAQCAAMPQACRNHVYIFLIDGEDPLDLANLNGVRDVLISLGYIKTYLGPCHSSGYFKDEIVRIHHDDESARFVLMGFSLGANAARELTEALRPAGVPVDLLVYCGGVGLANQPKGQPENVTRVIHILARGADDAGAALDGADNIVLSDVSHFGSPTHPYTVQLLGRELTDVASRVPVVDLRPASEPGVGPMPHAATARDALPRDEWDFLKTTPSAEPDMPKAP